MSKQIKQMAMDALKQQFQGVRDLVLLSVSGLSSQADNVLRANLRKKNIRVMMVKNSLLRRVFGELGVKPAEEAWTGPTIIAWGAESVKDLSREVETALLKDAKLKDKVRVKTALAEGQPVTFEQALKMPTRKEAIANVLGMVLGAAARVAACLTAPASKVASQVKTISEKKTEGEAAPAA